MGKERLSSGPPLNRHSTVSPRSWCVFVLWFWPFPLIIWVLSLLLLLLLPDPDQTSRHRRHFVLSCPNVRGYPPVLCSVLERVAGNARRCNLIMVANRKQQTQIQVFVLLFFVMPLAALLFPYVRQGV